MTARANALKPRSTQWRGERAGTLIDVYSGLSRQYEVPTVGAEKRVRGRRTARSITRNKATLEIQRSVGRASVRLAATLIPGEGWPRGR